MKKSFVIFFLLFFSLSFYRTDAEVISIFTPFGGKIEEYDPAPFQCVSEITLPVLGSTFSIFVTVEKVKVGNPRGGDFGVLRVNFVPIMPPPTNFYRYGTYFVPGTYIVGNSINFCSVCKQLKENKNLQKVGLGFLKDACEKIPAAEKVLKVICNLTGEGCPITNLIYNFGTSQPGAALVERGAEKATAKGREKLEDVKNRICKAVLDKIPLIGDLIGNICE